MKVVLCTIIVVITSNLIRKITLNMLFSVPCCEVHQIFFFLALHCNAFSYHNFEIERSQYCKWYVPRTPNSSFYFPKASCNCWKRFPAYTFPIARFVNLRCWTVLPVRGPFAGLRTVALSIVCRSVGRQSEARQSLGQCMHRMQCLVGATSTYTHMGTSTYTT